MASKSISKSVIWQLAGKFALQGLALLTTPIFTRILAPNDYGYTALYNSWLDVFVLFIGLQTSGTIGTARIKYNFDKGTIYSYLATLLTTSVISFVFFFTITYTFKDNFESITGIDKDFGLILIIHSFSLYILSFIVTKFDQFKQVEKSTILSAAYSVLSIICSLCFLFFISCNKAKLKILGQFLPVLIISIIIILFVYMKGKSIFKKEYFIYCIKLAMPFVLHGLASVVFIHCDKIMLNRLQGDAAVGLYSTAFSLVSVLFIIHSSLNTAWVPFYFDLKKENDTTEILIHSKRLMKFFLLISSGFILMAYDVFKILTPNTYWQAMSLFPFFVLSNYFLFLYLFPSNFEVFSEKNIFLSVGTSFTALLNIILNYFLIKAYGYIGAAISTLISNISLFIFHEIIAFTIGKGKYENKIFFYLYSIGILLVFIFIARLFKDLFIVRWIIACMIAIYLLLDIKKRRSIF